MLKHQGEQVDEVHGANKPLDPNYKPEHQSKSKLPSVTVKSFPAKTPIKPILRTPARPTWKALSTPKLVTIQSEPMNDMPAPIPNPTPIGTPVLVHGRAWSKTYRVDGTPLLLPTALPPPSQPQLLVPRRILSSTPSGENKEDVDKRGMLIRGHDDKRQILRDQNQKIFHPPPIEGIDIGVMEGSRALGLLWDSLPVPS